MATAEFVHDAAYSSPVRLGDGGLLSLAGSTGAIVHVYEDAGAFEVEITHPLYGVVTVEADDLEALTL